MKAFFLAVFLVVLVVGTGCLVNLAQDYEGFPGAYTHTAGARDSWGSSWKYRYTFEAGCGGRCEVFEMSGDLLSLPSWRRRSDLDFRFNYSLNNRIVVVMSDSRHPGTLGRFVWLGSTLQEDRVHPESYLRPRLLTKEW